MESTNEPVAGTPILSRRQVMAAGVSAGAGLIVGATAVTAAAAPSEPATRGDAGHQPGPTSAYSVVLGPKVVLVPQTDQLHQYPYSFASDKVISGELVREVRVGINRQPDDPDAPQDTLFMVSIDYGASWATHTPQGGVPRIELPNGTQLNFGFYTSFAAGTGGLQVEVRYERSTDGGATIVSGVGTLVSGVALQPSATNSARARLFVHDRPFVGVDGAVYQPAYGAYVGDTGVRSLLLRTADLGQNWTIRSTIAYEPGLLPNDPAYEGLGEPNVVRLDDDSLLAVMRTGSWRPLYYARSTDAGATWTAVQKVLSGPNGDDVLGVNPKLRMLPNGLLTMMTGRDLIRLYVSADGTGQGWSEQIVVSDMGYESGNGGMEVLDDDRVLIVGDRRSNLRPPNNTTYKYEIWSRTVTLAHGE